MAFVSSRVQGGRPSNVLAPTLRRQRRWRRYSGRTFYLFASPWILGFLGLTVLPLLYALLVSFTNYDGLSPRWHWIGLANYQELFIDPDTWWSLGRTVLYTALSVPLSVGGGLLLAILLNRKMRGITLLRGVFYLPAVIPIVASVFIWRIIFDRDAGAFNALLGQMHLPAGNWLADPQAFTPLIVIAVWMLGSNMVISLAGLQGVPHELRESATVEGANAWLIFRRITLPLLSPVLFFEVVITVINAMQVLVQPLLLAPGRDMTTPTNVPRSNFVFMVNVYQQFLYNNRPAYGSALLWIFFLLVLAFTLLVFRSGKFWVYYEVETDK